MLRCFNPNLSKHLQFWFSKAVSVYLNNFGGVPLSLGPKTYFVSVNMKVVLMIYLVLYCLIDISLPATLMSIQEHSSASEGDYNEPRRSMASPPHTSQVLQLYSFELLLGMALSVCPAFRRSNFTDILILFAGLRPPQSKKRKFRSMRSIYICYPSIMLLCLS